MKALLLTTGPPNCFFEYVDLGTKKVGNPCAKWSMLCRCPVGHVGATPVVAGPLNERELKQMCGAVQRPANGKRVCPRGGGARPPQSMSSFLLPFCSPLTGSAPPSRLQSASHPQPAVCLPPSGPRGGGRFLYSLGCVVTHEIFGRRYPKC